MYLHKDFPYISKSGQGRSDWLTLTSTGCDLVLQILKPIGALENISMEARSGFNQM